jgi:hypothetical protein
MACPSRTLLTITGLAILGVLAPAIAGAQTAPVGVVTTLDGIATLTRVSLPGGITLKPRDPVYLADRIVTGDRSFARILLGGKALVTVRERSALTITEVPGTARIEVATGKIGLAVVKERMKPGESIEIRTPNAVAAIRGTVVITEVSQATSQLSASSAAWTTTVTVLRGAIEFRALDAITRQPVGPALSVSAMQSIRVSGAALPRPVQTITREAAERLASDLRGRVKDPGPSASAPIAESQMREATSRAAAIVSGTAAAQPPQGAAGDRNAERQDDGERRGEGQRRGAGGVATASAPGSGNAAPAAGGSASGPPAASTPSGQSAPVQAAPAPAAPRPAAPAPAAAPAPPPAAAPRATTTPPPVVYATPTVPVVEAGERVPSRESPLERVKGEAGLRRKLRSRDGDRR